MLKCPFCTKKFSYPSNLDCHLVAHTKERPYKCPICPEDFGHKQRLTEHIRIVHDGIKKTRKLNHQCTMCSFKSCSTSSLQVHVRKHFTELPFSCHRPGCSYRTKYKSALSKHVRQVHSGKRPFKCPSDGCSYKAKFRADISKHLRVHSNDKPFSCTVPGCNYTCKAKNNLKRHTSRIHSDEKPFKCSVCDFRATVKRDVIQHQVTHSKIKRFRCQAPNCTFASHQSFNLKRHCDRKHRASEVVCTEPRCNFRCGSVALLKEHLKKHELPNLKCPVDSCSFRTKYSHGLLNHISLSHKGFQSSVTVGTRISDLKTAGTMNTLHCSYTDCSFQTNFRHLYYRHVITHKKQEEGQHVCSFCFSRFSQSNLLRAHVQRHIREKPFSCSHCNYTTKYSFQLNVHARKIHQIHVIPRSKADQVRNCCTCGRNCFSYVESVLHSMSHLQPVVVLKQLKLHVL